VSGVWREKPATQAQQHLAFGSSRGKATQASVILQLLRTAREQGRAVELPELLNTRIAQIQARLYELRRKGHVIENELEHVGGEVRSRYRLVFDVEVGA
jgi:hypothetical protein